MIQKCSGSQVHKEIKKALNSNVDIALCLDGEIVARFLNVRNPKFNLRCRQYFFVMRLGWYKVDFDATCKQNKIRIGKYKIKIFYCK